MVHNCRVDGFNLFARDAVNVSARDFSRSPWFARLLEIIAQAKRDPDVHFSTAAVLHRRRSVDFVIGF